MKKHTHRALLALGVVALTTAGGPVAPALAGDSDESPAEVPPTVTAALQAALVVPGGRLTVRSFKVTGAAGASCSVSEASMERPIEGSGRFPVKVFGRGCAGWAWA